MADPSRPEHAHLDGVSAVVLSYNGLETLKHVIAALCEQANHDIDVLVVDNASTDGTQRWLADQGVDSIQLEVNMGVGAGHSIGWKKALADGANWLWVLEHDTIPTSSCLAALAVAVERASAGREAAYICRLERNKDEASDRQVDRLPELREGKRTTFNGLLMHRSLVERAGFPREDFFVGMEDWDYSRRLGDLGIPIFQVRDALALHRTKGNRRLGIRANPSRSYYSTRNWLYTEIHEIGGIRGAFAALRAVASIPVQVFRDEPVARVRSRFWSVYDGMLGHLGATDRTF